MEVAVVERDWGQQLVDVTTPNVARVYDFYLGGLHNFPADQDLASKVVAAYPWVPEIMLQNRAFLRRAVTHMATLGIRQFLDLGAGLPTEGAVHEVAQGIQPSASVIYVDIDPVAIVHTKQILGGNPLCAAVQADFGDFDAILSDPQAAALLDMSQPIGVLSLSTLHFLGDDTHVRRIVQTVHDHVAPGSLYAITHGSADERPDRARMVEELYRRSGTPFTLRSRQQLHDLIAPPFRIMSPGLAPMDQWRAHDEMQPITLSEAYACVAVKPPAGVPTQAAPAT
jgi:hypothetical protein